jgi:hypothetical protein
MASSSSQQFVAASVATKNIIKGACALFLPNCPQVRQELHLRQPKIFKQSPGLHTGQAADNDAFCDLFVDLGAYHMKASTATPCSSNAPRQATIKLSPVTWECRLLDKDTKSGVPIPTSEFNKNNICFVGLSAG